MRVKVSPFWARVLVALGGHWAPDEQERRLRYEIAQEIREEAILRREKPWGTGLEYIQGMEHAADLIEQEKGRR